MNRPNILYIHSHDTGRYLQPYGHAIDTPNYQKLAEQGVLFRQAFCAAPTCSPSRAALLTGQCPHQAGMLGLAHRGFRLHDYRQHIVHTLRPAGYQSIQVGIQHIAHPGVFDPEQVGYDHSLATDTRSGAVIAQAAAAFLKSKPATPFFLDVGFFETHRKFPPAMPADDPRYVLPPAPLPDTPALRRDMAEFHTMARQLDGHLGVVLATLEETGLSENTLVLATTDHGIAFPDMKCRLTDHGLGVLLLMRGPGDWRGGKVIDAMVSHLDIYPTFCELAGVEIPPWVEGASLQPLIRGQIDRLHDEIFGEVTYHAAYEPMRAVRTQRWKYIRHFSPRARPVLPNVDDGLAKQAWLQAGWATVRAHPLAEELFDLALDPQERCNRAEDPLCAAALADHRQRLEQWMRRTDDPLLRGNIPLPKGAVANSVEGLHASHDDLIRG